MDSRKVSCMSTLSNMSNMSNRSNISLISEGSDLNDKRSTSNLVLEELCELPTGLAVQPRRVSSTGKYVSILSGDTQILILEVQIGRDRECQASCHAVLDLPGIQEEKKYLDASIFSTGQDSIRLAVLGERKNKERFVSILSLLVGDNSVRIGQEMTVYDKASMLGKGLSHIVSCGSGVTGQAEVFVSGNIIRKLRVEEDGCVLKPTTGRVQVPQECVDGTQSICVSSSMKNKQFSVVASFKTKSAGKNKYQINWFQGRNDEISPPTAKSVLKLSEDQEPTVVLVNPGDSRTIFLVCNNSSDNTSSLHKLVRGRKLQDSIFKFSFPVSSAVIIPGDAKDFFLLLLNSSTLSLVVFHVSKTEGFRGQESSWSACPQLSSVSPAYSLVSCSQYRWQLQTSQADTVLADTCPYQVSLATLLTAGGDIAAEPDTGASYRVRIMGGDINNDAIIIVLDDLERIFESEEESLSSMTLKMCMNTSPSREGLSLISAWLMAGRLGQVEIQSSRLETVSGSDRMVLQSLKSDTLRSYLVETDWTQKGRREGTFLLDSAERACSTPAEIRTSTPLSRRTPESPGLDGVLTVLTRVEDSIPSLTRASQEIGDSLAALEKNIGILRNIHNTRAGRI